MNPLPSGDHAAILAALVAAVRAVDPRIAVRLNDNQRTFLSLRYARDRSAALSLHRAMLDHPAALAEIPTWIRSQGRIRHPAIDLALRQIGQTATRHAIDPSEHERLRALPTVGDGFDLLRGFIVMHGAWFRHLPPPGIDWARDTGPGRLRHIRFGCYRKAPARITLHPRLGRPWVARVFVEHVIFHELCHHAQACDPQRGEPIHSPRFRSWERRFPHHGEALAWERAFVHHLLDGTAPG